MLAVTENDGGFVVVGDAVMFFTQRGSRTRVAIDSPAKVLRSGIVIKQLIAAGFKRMGEDNNRWKRDGRVFTLKEAIDESGRNKVDPRGR